MGDNLPPQCIKITKEFMDDKLSSLFMEPFHPDKDLQDEYYSIIKKPMDLSTVMRKLKENSYLSIGDWSDDMKLIFDNAINFNGEESLVGSIAVYLKRKLVKRMKIIENLNSRNFENQIINLTLDLNKTLLSPPDPISVEINDQSEIDKLGDFSQSQIEGIRQNLKSLITDNKKDQIIKCLNDSGNELIPNTQQHIDIAKLGRNSLLELKALCNK